MSDSAHRIRRLRWQARTSSESEAFVLRSALRYGAGEPLLAELERELDALVPGGEVVRVPRLELRLRVGSFAELPGAARESFAGQLAEQLRGARPDSLPAREREPSRQPTEAERFDTLCVYLASGHLPWHRTDRTSAAAGDLGTTALARLPDVLHALRSRASGERLVDALARLLRLLPVERWPAVEEVVGSGSGSGAPARDKSGRVTATQAGGAPDLREIARVFASRLDPTIAPARDRVASAASAPAHSSGLTRQGTSSRAGRVRRTRTRDAAADMAVREVRGAAPTRERPPVTAGEPARPAEAQHPREGDAANEPETLTVASAGLVLLHPFLPAFFEATGVLEGTPGAIATERLPRAAALLHLLATGEREPHEYELGFVKVLLGLPPDYALPDVAGRVGDTDAEEADALLASVLSHWSALGATTVAGLRATFLRREGLLRESGPGWLLQVQPESFDVLLARLPWGIGVVKCPWNPKPILVEWTTG